MFPAIYHFLRKLLFDERAFGRWSFAVLSTAAYITGQYSDEIGAAFAQPWLATAVDYVCGGICGAAGASSVHSISIAAKEAKARKPKGDE